ncbi:hypothetical protein [Myxococcus eversor]|uniref:hypothetical protein n=1 Tax=Myxococcus eversor TaxID=2709661 RepID=UPI0013D5959E|nr:hypothetical protein [Myxococcus eversor]
MRIPAPSSTAERLALSVEQAWTGPRVAVPAFRGGTQKIVNAQLAFDDSPTGHRVAQNAMWSHVLRVTDGLIRLLKATEDARHPGSSLWQRSLIYFATDFGREKHRPTAGTTAFGTGHHLNNGVVLVSPRLKGNRVYGGVDPSTCLTYGFDRVSGAPAPGTVMGERDVYSAICGALPGGVQPGGGHVEGRAVSLAGPRHNSGPLIVGAVLLPALLLATFWGRREARALRAYLIATNMLLLALVPIMSGWSGLDVRGFEGLMQRLFALAIHPPIGVGAWFLAKQVREVASGSVLSE